MAWLRISGNCAPCIRTVPSPPSPPRFARRGPHGAQAGIPARPGACYTPARPIRSAVVQLEIIGLNLLYAVAGVVLMFLSYRLIDRLTPEVNFPAELSKGNVAVAIFVASIFISIALIIGNALN